jgi:hypothetical protein
MAPEKGPTQKIHWSVKTPDTTAGPKERAAVRSTPVTDLALVKPVHIHGTAALTCAILCQLATNNTTSWTQIADRGNSRLMLQPSMATAACKYER